MHQSDAFVGQISNVWRYIARLSLSKGEPACVSTGPSERLILRQAQMSGEAKVGAADVGRGVQDYLT